jgi:hypothetical protein
MSPLAPAVSAVVLNNLKEKIMKIKRFSLAITVVIALLLGAIGIANRASAATVCSPATAISVPFAKDGVGDVCLQTSSLCTYINSWNTTTIEVNGTAYTNIYVAASSIAPLNGGYTIHYVSTVAWGHFEIGAPCAAGNTPTKTNTLSAATVTRTPFPSATPERSPTSFITVTRTRTLTPGGTALTATRTNTAGPITATVTRTFTPTISRTPTSGPSNTPTAVATTGTGKIGNATWFSSLGQPYGGCGVTQSALDTQNFIALNVQNSPGDYTTFHPRPIAPEFANVIGAWNNGLNCGRWVKVTISDYCNGTNDGAQNLPFCRGGLGYVTDAYNGATLDMIVADSCYDSNAWCRDDPYHIDLAQASLNTFVKNGAPVGDMDPLHWNNRHVQWEYEAAPNYTGDIKIGFIQGAQVWWSPIAITHLLNGIHGVDYFDGTNWIKAAMDSDMGQTYMILPTVSGGTAYRIRVYDVNNQLINNGRIYNFSFPAAACGTQCSNPFNEVTYTIQ